MADPASVTEWTQGDTYPTLRLALSDDDGLRNDLPDAELILFKAKQNTPGTAIIQGTATVIDPPDPDGFNLEYDWQAADTAIDGTYRCEVKVTWDTSTTPDNVESWSSSAGDLPTLVIRPALVP